MDLYDYPYIIPSHLHSAAQNRYTTHPLAHLNHSSHNLSLAGKLVQSRSESIYLQLRCLVGDASGRILRKQRCITRRYQSDQPKASTIRHIYTKTHHLRGILTRP